MFLRDQDIRDLIAKGGIEHIADFTSDPDGPKSPVQPCSLDLTIGKIYVPGVPAEGPGGSENPKTANHLLQPGMTAVVETREVFHLPNNIGAFGFPPTAVSKVAVLLTNLGHIDPGYDGTIRFTLLNMGLDAYTLRVGDPIYTLLLFQLQQDSNKSYRDRHPQINTKTGSTGVDQPLLDSLSVDFLDVTSRAERVASEKAAEAVSKELRSRSVLTAVMSVLTAIIAAAATLGVSMFSTCSRVDRIEGGLSNLKAEISKKTEEIKNIYDTQLEIQKLKSQIETLSKRQTETQSLSDGQASGEESQNRNLSNDQQAGSWQ